MPFHTALHTWQRCDSMRRNRQRFKQYTYGDQWADIIDDGYGHMMPEREVIKLTGARPLTNNLIRRLVKTIVGRFRTIADEEKMYSSRPDSPDVINHLPELDARLLEEFLISGCAIQRISRYRDNVPGMALAGAPRVDNIPMSRFFIDSVSDPRGWDARLVGVLHDMTPGDIVARLAHADSARARAITEVYRRVAANPDTITIDEPDVGAPIDAHACANFFSSPLPGKCRLIEVWTLDSADRLICHNPDDGSVIATAPSSISRIEQNNQRRIKAGLKPCETAFDRQLSWRCRWFAPDGTLLATEDSPLRSGALPFIFKFYPLTDAEVHPFVEDLISQQKYINRLITLIDRMIGSSAKGVLLFPVNQKPASVTWQQVRDSWSACGGIIPIIGDSDVLPQQIQNSASDNAASSLLSLELKLFEEVSGVTGALMGREAASSTGSSLYEAQVRNASIALADTFLTFRSFINSRNILLSQL